MGSEQGPTEPAADESHDGTDGQDYVDRSKIDFDPDDGLLSGTAIDGTSEIPGPHKQDQTPDDNDEPDSNDDD